MNAAAKTLADLMTERELARAIGDACRVRGLLSYFTLDSRGSPEGYPDRMVILPGDTGNTLLAWELKTAKGKPTPAQLRWLAELGKVTRVDARVIRPCDLDRCINILLGRRAP